MECPVRFYGPSRIPGVFCKKSVPCADARVNRTWKRPIQRRSLGNSHRAGRRVRGKEGAGFFAVGFNRPASLRPSGAGCFPHMYVEKLYGTKRHARCIGAGRKDAGPVRPMGKLIGLFLFLQGNPAFCFAEKRVERWLALSAFYGKQSVHQTGL